MKKYLIAITIVSIGFAFCITQINIVLASDPVTSAQQNAVDKFKELTDTVRARAEQLRDEEYAKIVASGKYSPKQLAIIKQAMDAGTAASLQIVFQQASLMCERVGAGVTKCDLTPEGKKTMSEMIQNIALTAVAQGEGRISDVRGLAEAYAGQKIAAHEALVYQKMVEDSLNKIQLANRMLSGEISQARMKLYATGWIINAPWSLFSGFRPQWNAGSIAVLVGQEGQKLLREITNWTTEINILIKNAEASIRRGDGSYTEEDLRRDMKSVQTLLSNIQNNSRLIMGLIYKDVQNRELTDAMNNLALTNAAAAKALRTYGPMVIAAASSVDEALRTIQSPEVQDQMDMLGNILNKKVNTQEPLDPQLQKLLDNQLKTNNGSTTMPPKKPATQTPMPTILIDVETQAPVKFIWDSSDRVFKPIPANAPLPQKYDITETTINGVTVWAIVPRGNK